MKEKHVNEVDEGELLRIVVVKKREKLLVKNNHVVGGAHGDIMILMLNYFDPIYGYAF
ncbi:hypothetical protein [Bacillus coahuilensis]|uniref:hypothetical protein n=1 Tax=Bacillus coahuilensis TaxID=408580 RepID=UPI0001850A53|nr:hypothetical protein [Bacillus coahuilensis]